MNNIKFTTTRMFVDWKKVKEYWKTFSVIEKSNWIDKNCKINWRELNWIIYIDEMVNF